MHAPRVFISMICALLVFSVATYFIHGSFYTAFIQTLICLVIIQVGYFAGVVFLVSREKKRMRKTLEFQKNMQAANESSAAENMAPVARHRPKLTDI